MRYGIKTLEVIDSRNEKKFEGTLSACQNFIRLCTASIFDVSEQDEISHTLELEAASKVAWYGELKLRPVIATRLTLTRSDWRGLLRYINTLNKIIKQ